jgi:hypothetical protein
MKRCSADKKGPKRRPYGLKGWDYCTCDTHIVNVVNKKAARQAGKKEVSSQLRDLSDRKVFKK